MNNYQEPDRYKTEKIWISAAAYILFMVMSGKLYATFDEVDTTI